MKGEMNGGSDEDGEGTQKAGADSLTLASQMPATFSRACRLPFMRLLSLLSFLRPVFRLCVPLLLSSPVYLNLCSLLLLGTNDDAPK